MGRQQLWVEQLRQALQRIEKLEQKLEFYQPDKFILKPDTNFINCVSKKFNLIEHDEYKLQCTGIDQDVLMTWKQFS